MNLYCIVSFLYDVFLMFKNCSLYCFIFYYIPNSDKAFTKKMMKLAAVLAGVVASALADSSHNTENREVELIPYAVIGDNTTLSSLELSFPIVVNNFSFYMTCESSAFQSNGNGLWDRLAFRTALANSYNTVAMAERTLLTTYLQSIRPNGDLTRAVQNIYYLLAINNNEHPAHETTRSMFNNITFDRVLESTAKGFVRRDERNV